MTNEEYIKINNITGKDLEAEIWRRHPIYRYYESSNLSRVRSLDKLVKVRGMHSVIKKGKLLKQKIDRDRRFCFALTSSNKRIYKQTHRFTLECFKGLCPQNMEACHNDGNKTNNRIENLRWDTRKNNNKDRIKHGQTNTGDKCTFSKLHKDSVDEIRCMNKTGLYSQRQIAKEYDVSQAAIWYIVNNKVWVK